MMLALLGIALAADQTIDLSAFYNHDLFVERPGPAPYLRMQGWSPLTAPMPLNWDGRASPDVVLLRSKDAPNAPVEVQIPLTQAARTLYVLTAGQGELSVRDIAADGTLTYADGRTQGLKWMVGEQIWPAWAGATGRSADVVELGTNAGGDVVTASLLTVVVAFPEVPLASLTLRSRSGSLSVGLLALVVSDDPPRTVQAVAAADPTQWYDFRVPAALERPLPIDPALAVSGPVTRRVVARDGHLYYEDGERARFWGINLVSEGALPPKEEADIYAQSLARAGFNLVRLHHLDFDGPDALLSPDRSPLLRPEIVDRLDYFVAALARAGVYVFLESFTRRSFTAAEGVPSPEGVPLGHKYVSFFWPEWLEAEKQWFRALYGRVNPYTGRRYADEPAVAMLEIANENSLLVGWHGGSLDRLPGPHRKRLDQLWTGWLRLRYGNDARLAAAWANNTRGGLLAGESLLLGSVEREPSSRNRADLYPTARGADLLRFYSALEADHYREMLALFQDELGFEAPTICNTSFGVPSADALLGMCDIVDVHTYWDPIAESHVFQNTSLIAAPNRFLEAFGRCQEGKPCTFSEVGHSYPNRYTAEAPLWWAASAARQDLDAVIWFAYRHGPYRAAPDGPDGALDLEGRFSSWVQMPTASALYRSGAIAPPTRRFVRWWSPDAIFRDLAEGQGLWLDPLVSWSSLIDNVLRSSFAPRPPPLQTAPLPAPAPLRWSVEAGTFAVDTDRFRAWIGPAGASPAGSLQPTLSGFAAVSLASLDGQPLGQGRALLTVAGRCEREGTTWSTGGPGALTWGRGPARMEALTGAVRFPWAQRPRAWALDETGARREEVRVRRAGRGWWEIDLTGLQTPWVEVGG